MSWFNVCAGCVLNYFCLKGLYKNQIYQELNQVANLFCSASFHRLPTYEETSWRSLEDLLLEGIAGEKGLYCTVCTDTYECTTSCLPFPCTSSFQFLVLFFYMVVIFNNTTLPKKVRLVEYRYLFLLCYQGIELLKPNKGFNIFIILSNTF